MDGFVTFVVGFGGKSFLAESTLKGFLASMDANMLGKVFTSVFCVFVAAFMFGVNQVGGSILESAVSQLNEVGAPSGERMAAYLDFPLVVDHSL